MASITKPKADLAELAQRLQSVAKALSPRLTRYSAAFLACAFQEISQGLIKEILSCRPSLFASLLKPARISKHLRGC